MWDKFYVTELPGMNATFRSVLICLLLTGNSMANPEIRIDDAPEYEQWQDINKALQNSDSLSWMYLRTYLPVPGEPEYACVYAKVARLQEEGNYMFMQGWTQADGSTIEVPLFVNTTRTPGDGYTRKKDNAMHVTLNIPQQNLYKDFGLYKLIYSDNEKCDILRVTSKQNGYACEMYLHSSALNAGVPRACQSIYRLACGREERYRYQVYFPNCTMHNKKSS
uniref:Putative salivary lipocalin n=1 Tax=Ixodes ricinus TaxID=34613 RepID=A0A0K8R7W5_IXORI